MSEHSEREGRGEASLRWRQDVDAIGCREASKVRSRHASGRMREGTFGDCLIAPRA